MIYNALMSTDIKNLIFIIMTLVKIRFLAT